MVKVMDAATAKSLMLEAISNHNAQQLKANYEQEEENLTESLLLEIYDNIEAAAKEGKFQTSHIIYDEVSFINEGKIKLSIGYIVSNIIKVLCDKGFHVNYYILQYSQDIGYGYDYHLKIEW